VRLVLAKDVSWDSSRESIESRWLCLRDKHACLGKITGRSPVRRFERDFRDCADSQIQPTLPPHPLPLPRHPRSSPAASPTTPAFKPRSLSLDIRVQAPQPLPRHPRSSPAASPTTPAFKPRRGDEMTAQGRAERRPGSSTHRPQKSKPHRGATPVQPRKRLLTPRPITRMIFNVKKHELELWKTELRLFKCCNALWV
jgi:hypothetical protein